MARTASNRVAAGIPAAAGLTSRQREAIAGYVFVLPDALGLLVFIGIPMALALTLGFFDVDGFGGYRFVGLKNYQRLALDPLFWKSFWVTVTYVVWLVPALYVSGLGLALLVKRTNAFNGAMRSLFFMPQMVSLVVVALVWQVLAVDKIGMIPRLVSAMGFGSVSFLGSPELALFAVIFVSVWFLMGFYMLIFLGGLQDIPNEYYEAARIDGAGPLTSFWYITLPLLRPTSFFVLIVSMVAAVAGAQTFDLVYVMTRGGPANSTMMTIYYIYQQAFQYNAFGYAGALASIVVLALMAITILLFVLTRGGRFNYE